MKTSDKLDYKSADKWYSIEGSHNVRLDLSVATYCWLNKQSGDDK